MDNIAFASAIVFSAIQVLMDLPVLRLITVLK